MPVDHTTTWTSGTVEYTLETGCRPNEGADPCLARHLDDLAFFQEVYPPNT